ncbi:hypothetical protein M422DRAFT_240681 [Sphaerobolus stellatus SS14]|nr:hypothetical protein M422DRAFT_240681 [Sphaerobolus stellatus SS14]
MPNATTFPSLPPLPLIPDDSTFEIVSHIPINQGPTVTGAIVTQMSTIPMDDAGKGACLPNHQRQTLELWWVIEHEDSTCHQELKFSIDWPPEVDHDNFKVIFKHSCPATLAPQYELTVHGGKDTNLEETRRDDITPLKYFMAIDSCRTNSKAIKLDMEDYYDAPILDPKDLATHLSCDINTLHEIHDLRAFDPESPAGRSVYDGPPTQDITDGKCAG